MKMKTKLTLAQLSAFFLISFLATSTLNAQENFDIRQKLNRQMIRKHSVQIAKVFEKKIVDFNKNHQDMSFFLESYSEEKDRRFLEQYFERHRITGFKPFAIHEGKAKAQYNNVLIEIGPVEALENKVILNGEAFKLTHQQGLRARIVEIEQLIDDHFQPENSTGQVIRNLFSHLSLISSAHATSVNTDSPLRENAETTEAQKEKFFSQSIVAALIVAGDKIHLKPDVYRDASEKDKFLNIKAMLEKFEKSNKQCQEDLTNMRNLHASDLSEHESYIPVTSIQDFAFAGELNARVEELEDREIDIASFAKMTELLESHFSVRFSSILDRNVCWGLFSRPFVTGKEDPLLDRGCSSFDQLHDCLVEMRHIDRISEVRRSEVSKKFYEGRILPRENAFRSGRSSAQSQ